MHVFVNKTDLVDLGKLKQDWNEHSAEIDKIRADFKVKSLFFVSAKTTPR